MAFPLPTPELDRFAGTYSSDDGPGLTLAVEAGRLTLRAASGERFALEPHAPLEFFFPEIPEARLAFGESGGRVTGLEWRPRRGMPVEARRTG
jgi:hypothetical protein